MNIAEQITDSLHQALAVSFFELENESHLHSGNAPESHFKLTLASNAFEGLSKVKRHQLVYRILDSLMPQFHALALHTFSETEWTESQMIPASTPCKGGH